MLRPLSSHICNTNNSYNHDPFTQDQIVTGIHCNYSSTFIKDKIRAKCCKIIIVVWQ